LYFFFNYFFTKGIFIIGTLTIFGSLVRGDIVQIENLGEHCQLSDSLRGYVNFTIFFSEGVKYFRSICEKMLSELYQLSLSVE
jgi:hypothetical protein